MSKKYCNSNLINLTQNVEENEILHEIFRLVSLFFPDKFRVMENQLTLGQCIVKQGFSQCMYWVVYNYVVPKAWLLCMQKRCKNSAENWVGVKEFSRGRNLTPFQGLFQQNYSNSIEL